MFARLSRIATTIPMLERGCVRRTSRSSSDDETVATTPLARETTTALRLVLRTQPRSNRRIVRTAILLLLSMQGVNGWAVEGEPIEEMTWQGTVVVEGNRVLPAERTLTVAPGTTLNMGPKAVVYIDRDATLRIDGTRSNPVRVQRLNPGQDWGRFRVHTNGSRLMIRHADISGGKISFGEGSLGELEDVYLHDVQTPLMIAANHAELITLKRCHFADYFDVNYNFTRIEAEDCLFENVESDAFELIGAPAGCRIRRCTFRHCWGDGSDAIDINGGDGVEISNSLFYDIRDKAVSMGSSIFPEQGVQESRDIVIRDSLIYQAGTGLSLKENSEATLERSIIAESTLGLRMDGAKNGAGAKIVRGELNIIWGNATGVELQPFAELGTVCSIIQGGDDKEEHVYSLNPEFADPGMGDYRPMLDFPAATQTDCQPPGPVFPVGAGMAASHPVLSEITLVDPEKVLIQFHVDPERSYMLQRKNPGEQRWIDITQVSPQATPYMASIPFSLNGTVMGIFRVIIPFP